MSAWFGAIPSMFATGLVNLIGSCVLGLVVASFAPLQRGVPNPLVLFLGVGFSGGLTTFSTLAMELTDLLQSKKYGWCLAYGLGSLTLGVLSFLAGVALRLGEIKAD
jgi:CrcB protein